MPNVEFIARNGIVSRGNLVVSGSVISTSPASFSGSLSVTGSIVSTNNIQGNQFSSTVGSVIGGRYFSDVLIAAGTVTYGSYGTSNVANFDIYANNENVGNGAQLRLSSRFGGDNGAYLVSALTGSVVLAVNGTGNSGLVLNGSTMNVGIGVSTPTGRLQVRGSGATSSTTAFLVQNANASSSLVVKDNSTVIVGTGTPTTSSILAVYGNSTTESIDLEVYRDFSAISAYRTATLRLTTRNNTGNHGGQNIDFRHEGINSSPGVVTNARISNFSLDSGNGPGSFAISTTDTAPYGTTLRTKIAIDNYGNIQLSDATDAYVYLGNTYAYGPRTGKVFTVAGQGNTGYTGDHLIIRGGSPEGSNNLTGGNLILQGGYSRGTAGSDIILQVPIPSGSSGNVLNSTYRTAMFISGSGNIGIGTSTPTSTLHVSGSSRFTGELLMSGSTQNRSVKLTDSGLYISRTSDGTYPSAITADGAMYFDTRNSFIFRNDGTATITFQSDTRNVLIGPDTSDLGRLVVKGSGTTSSTTALLVQNSSGQSYLQVLDSGVASVGKIGDGELQIYSGNYRTYAVALSNKLEFQDAYGVTGALNSTGLVLTSTSDPSPKNRLDVAGRVFIGSAIAAASASLHISSSLTGSIPAVLIQKSGSTVLDIQGSQGQLFSVIDALSGSLMSVNDISGLPIVEVFSDDRVVMGTYGAPAVIISGSNTVISGSLRGRVITLSTASATASMDCSLSNFFDLTLSGSMYLTPTNILPGETINLRITQPATSGSLNYTSSIKFPNGLPYTASATSSVVDLVSFISFDSSTLYATAIKNLV